MQQSLHWMYHQSGSADLNGRHNVLHLAGDDFLGQGQDEGKAGCQEVIAILLHAYQDLPHNDQTYSILMTSHTPIYLGTELNRAETVMNSQYRHKDY